MTNIMYDLDDGWGEERAGLGFTTAQPRVGNTNGTTRVTNTQTNKHANTQTQTHNHTITQIQTHKHKKHNTGLETQMAQRSYGKYVMQTHIS